MFGGWLETNRSGRTRLDARVCQPHFGLNTPPRCGAKARIICRRIWRSNQRKEEIKGQSVKHLLTRHDLCSINSLKSIDNIVTIMATLSIII